MSSATQTYYQSHSKLSFIGQPGQQKLSAAKVLVIGAGGLGCPCLLLLAGAGVGTVGVADFDAVSLSNLHRQTLFTFNDVGKPKTAIAKQRLATNNPYIVINEHPLMVDETNVLDLIQYYDVVIDGTDNFAVRYLVNDACVYLDKPLVYGAIYQAEGHLTVFNYQKSATLRCLFAEPDAEAYVPSCADVGAYNVVTQIIGTMMANEAIKLILGQAGVLVNKLFNYDALSANMRAIHYKINPQSRQTSISRFSGAQIPADILPEEFLTLQPTTYHLFDVRDDWERDEFNIGGQHLPMHQLQAFNFDKFLKTDKLIFYCRQGSRSKMAVAFLRNKGFIHAVSLKGGMAEYQHYV